MYQSSYLTFAILSILIFATSCSGPKESPNSNNTIQYSIRAGGNWGGIIEDTEIDAISGATNVRFAVGAHIIIPKGNFGIETGLDMLGQDQTLTYYNEEKEIMGERNFQYTTLSIPLTLNWNAIRNTDQLPILGFKIGLAGLYALKPGTKESGNPISYEWNSFSVGPVFGLYSRPIHLKNGNQLGLYVDFYRGSKVYKDALHQGSDVGNLSSLQFGVSLGF